MSQARKAASAYDQAVQWLRKRLDLDPAQVADLGKAYGQASVDVTKGLGDVIEAKAREATADIVARGMHVSQGVGRMREAFDAAGVTIEKPFLLETLVRTQIQTAYSAGQWQANQDEAIQEILWGYEYVTVGDDRVRPNHAAMDGTRAPQDDPIWSIWTPPAGFNCRCSLIEIFNGDANATTHYTAPGAEPDDGFAFNPGKVFRDVLAAVA